MVWVCLLACSQVTGSDKPSLGESFSQSSPVFTTTTTGGTSSTTESDTGTQASTVDPTTSETGDTGSVTPPDTGDSGLAGTTTGPTWTPPNFEVSVEPGARVDCADPSRRESVEYDRLELSPPSPLDEALPGSGVLVANLTGDATPEILFAGVGWIAAYGWDGEEWVDIVSTLMPEVEVGRASTFSAADYDGDGDLDVFVGSGGPNQLLRNDEGVLVDVSAESGLAGPEWFTVSGSWADFDRDGDLDLMVGNYGTGPEAGSVLLRPAHPSELYRNQGDGTFVDISDQLPLEVQAGFVFMTGWVDLDRDGWPDLLSLHDFGWVRQQSHVVHNDRGRLSVDWATAFHPNYAGMGLAIGDLDQDGGVEIAQTSASDLSLRFAQPEPVAKVGWAWPIESASAYRLYVDVMDRGQRFGWGLDLADIDNDGDEDLPVVFGWWSEYPDMWVDQHDGLYLYDAAERSFEDRGAYWGVNDTAAGRGLAVADINGDGWPDLVKRQLGLAPNVVYTSRCGEAHWLRVQLRDDATANRFGIGARLELTAGDRRWTRWIHAGSRSMFAGTPPEAHIGLAESEAAELTVVWPDGQVSVLGEVTADQVLTVRRMP